MKLLNSNIFPLPGTNKSFNHLATLSHGFKEFMYFIDTLTGKTYIEEITGGHLSFVEDENLVEEIEQFLIAHNLHSCCRVPIADSIWRTHPLSKTFRRP